MNQNFEHARSELTQAGQSTRSLLPEPVDKTKVIRLQLDMNS